MAYVTSDGRVVESEPWSIKKIVKFFRGIIFMIVMFFQTLVMPDSTSNGKNYVTDFRPGSGPPRPPTRRIGRLNTGSSVNVPFGCSSCSR